ncbi:MAG: response regulator [Armatimonadota bacterium]|nr:response regulator [Armatimonadota bacterium]
MYRVLIADDEEPIRLLLKEHIENLGHEVVAMAEDGEEAVLYAQDRQPDLAILDIRMPVVDGIEAANRILEIHPCAVIFLTGFAEEELLSRAEESGAFYYLLKPFRAQDLAPAITLSVARFRQLQERSRALAKAMEDLDARKIVERAKGILIDKHGMTEHEAFRAIHFSARRTNQPMAKVSEKIIETGEPPSETE